MEPGETVGLPRLGTEADGAPVAVARGAGEKFLEHGGKDGLWDGVRAVDLGLAARHEVLQFRVEAQGRLLGVDGGGHRLVLHAAAQLTELQLRQLALESHSLQQVDALQPTLVTFEHELVRPHVFRHLAGDPEVEVAVLGVFDCWLLGGSNPFGSARLLCNYYDGRNTYFPNAN